MSGASTSDFGKDNGLVHETVVMGRKAGWGRDAWSRLAENEALMRSLLPVIMGFAHVEVDTHVVDCTAAPFLPEGWRVAPANKQIASRFTGELMLTPEALALYLDPGQQSDGVVKGDELKKLLEGQPVLPANVLDYLIAHPALIPESWKGQYLFFWGTVYRYADGGLYVRYLYWIGDAWVWDCRWLDSGFGSTRPAAVPAS